jgi:hypothetical protein
MGVEISDRDHDVTSGGIAIDQPDVDEGGQRAVEILA